MKPYLLLILSFALFQLAFSQFTRDISRESWTLLTPGQVDNNDRIQSALRFGGNWIIRRGVLDGNMDDTAYDVTGIYAVHQLNAPGITYKFEMQVINHEKEIWFLKYDVAVNEATGAESVPRWRYSPEYERWDHFGGYQNLPKGIYGSDGAAEEEAPIVVPVEEAPIVVPVEEAPVVIPVEEAPIVVIQEEEAPIVIQEEEAPVVVQEEEAPVILEEEAPFVEIWEPVDPNVVDTNATVQTGLTFGINATIDRAVELGELPNFDYDMIGIYNVLTQINAPPGRDNFRYDVQVTNILEQLFRVKCDVAMNETTGRMWVYRWAYGKMDDPVWNGDLPTEFGEFDYLPQGEVFLALDETILSADEGATLLL